MEHSKVNQNIVRFVVKKAVERIQDDPKREMRKLVDMGDMLARGQFQTLFFEGAVNELEKPNSAYYAIGTRVIQQTRADALLGFGMNLGYNSLTSGAGTIRSTEARRGFNVPWMLFAEIADGGKVDARILDDLVQQGKGLGIYGYALAVRCGFDNMGGLAECIQRQGDCAFVLLMKPETAMLATRAGALQGLDNILVCVDVSDPQSAQTNEEAARLLRENCIFCAALHRARGDGDALRAACDAAACYGYALVFVLRSYDDYIREAAAIESALADKRSNLTGTVLPFDLLSDILMVDRAISSEGCLAFVAANGSIQAINAKRGTINTGCNVLHTRLDEALAAALPKEVTV